MKFYGLVMERSSLDIAYKTLVVIGLFVAHAHDINFSTRYYVIRESNILYMQMLIM